MTGELILTSQTYDDGRIAINNAFSGTANLNNLLLDGDFSGGTGGGVIYSAGTDLYDIFLTSDSTLASNGLTKNGNVIVLGGELSASTTISSPGFDLYLSGSAGVAGSINLYQKGLVGSSYGQVRAHNLLGAQLIGSDGINITNTVSTTNGTISAVYSSGGTNVELNVDSNGVSITDNYSNKGVFYNSNYHANYTNRSLPDVEWVTAHTFSSATNTWSSSTGTDSIIANNNTNNLASGFFSFAWGSGTTASGSGATSLGFSTVASGTGALAFGSLSVASASGAMAGGIRAQAKGVRSFAFGIDSEASGANSVAIGNAVTATTSDAMAIGQNNLASGAQSFVGGINSQASGPQSFAFGYAVRSSAEKSVTFGNSALTSGIYAFAAGSETSATTQASLAVGQSTLANGLYSFASGLYSNAAGTSSYAGGLGYDSSTLLRAGGAVAFNHSAILTTPFAGGADADYSAILGGKNIDISSSAERAIVLGMDNFTASESATTYVDNLYTNGYIDFNSGATLPSPKAGRLFFSGTPLFRLMLNTGGTVADWVIVHPL